MVSSEEAGGTAARTMPSVLVSVLRASDGILDLLPVATFICDTKGVILQYNRRAAEIWGREPRPGQTHDDFTRGERFYSVDGTPVPRSLLTDVLATGVPLRDVERVIDGVNGVRRTVSVNIDALRDARGVVIGAVNCFIDVTERKRMDDALEDSRKRASEQDQRLAATYEHAAIGITEVAPDGRFIRVNEAICAILGKTRDEILGTLLYTSTYHDDIDADREGFRKQVSGDLDFYSVEKRMERKDGRIIWVSVRSSPVRTPDGALLYIVRVVQDITERKIAEQRQKLLIDELNHRVKNTLATVQSLATQTSRGTSDPESFIERFEGRLIALSKAHDQLTVHHWERADLRELIASTVAPYAGTGTERIVLRGEDFVLRPRAVLTLAMVLHELTTNAAKYGALTRPSGGLEIAWRVAEGGTDRQLHIDWIERGGPPVSVPKRRGFGTRMIEGGVAAELGGRATLSFGEDGLRCALVMPLDAAQG